VANADTFLNNHFSLQTVESVIKDMLF